MEIFNTKADIICVAGKANTGDICQGSSSWHASLVVLKQKRKEEKRKKRKERKVVLKQMPSCEHISAVISGRIDLQIVDKYGEQVLFSVDCLAICIDPKVALGWLKRFIAKFDLYVWQCGLRWNCRKRACMSTKQV